MKTPCVAGKKPTVKIKPWPGERVMGATSPDSEKGAAGLEMEEIIRLASPEFLTSITVDPEPPEKSTICGLRKRFGTGADVPTPLRLTVTTGRAGSLLRMLNDPVKICAPVGANLTFKVMLAPGAIDAGNDGGSTIENGVAGPVIPDMTSGTPPAFDTVTVIIAGWLPPTEPKSIDSGETFMTATGGGGGE